METSESDAAAIVRKFYPKYRPGSIKFDKSVETVKSRSRNWQCRIISTMEDIVRHPISINYILLSRPLMLTIPGHSSFAKCRQSMTMALNLQNTTHLP